MAGFQLSNTGEYHKHFKTFIGQIQAMQAPCKGSSCQYRKTSGGASRVNRIGTSAPGEPSPRLPWKSTFSLCSCHSQHDNKVEVQLLPLNSSPALRISMHTMGRAAATALPTPSPGKQIKSSNGFPKGQMPDFCGRPVGETREKQEAEMLRLVLGGMAKRVKMSMGTPGSRQREIRTPSFHGGDHRIWVGRNL